MKTLFTIGEVSAITGIDRRTLKYYVERGIIVPSDKKVEGGKESWLYSEDDIFKIRQVALYRELGYSADAIKKLISSPSFNWREVLDHQIEELKAKKRHIENLIFAAEMMRYVNEAEDEYVAFDISDFDNNIDQFALNTFSYDEDELTSQSMERISQDIATGLSIADAYQQGQQIIDQFVSLRKVMDLPPDSEEVQGRLADMFTALSSLSGESAISLKDVLLGFRLISNLSFDRVSDVLFAREGSMDYLAKALQKYCDDIEGGKVNG